MLDRADSVRTTDREIEISRVVAAPRERVWQALTHPRQLDQWWGPRGFVTRTESMALRAGGQWRYLMIGPDGREYPNLVTYREVSPPSRLVYKHGGEKDFEHVNFESSITLQATGPGDAHTQVILHSVFPSAQAKELVVREYGAIEGGQQTLACLAEHLAGQQGTGSAQVDDAPADDAQAFVLTRVLQAPLQAVWDAWTQPQHLARWMSPAGMEVISAQMDLRPGGRYLYGLRMPGGAEMWGRWLFREVQPPRRLVWVHGFSNPAGEATRHPMAAQWPLEILSTLTLSEHAGIGRGTALHLHWLPINASAEERKVFTDGHASMAQGWGGTLQQLVEHLASHSPER